MGDAVINNVEGRQDFDVKWQWSEQPVVPGITAVLRVKNESRTIPYCLPSILKAVDEVVLVDNDSTDGTVELAVETARRLDRAGQLIVKHYPFEIARCGPEHLATPERSLHSLAYFYNWSFSHVRTRYSLKWDGDMVLTDGGVRTLRQLSWQLEYADAALSVLTHPLYVIDDRTALFDPRSPYVEPRLLPNNSVYAYAKGVDWEIPTIPASTRVMRLQDGLACEIKWLDADEFSNWSSTDFADERRYPRKSREWAVFEAHRNGLDPDELIRVEAPEGTHVIDFVRQVWLPQWARGPLPVRGLTSGAVVISTEPLGTFR
jgi:glycosyltransferase involved in cell wall biosynthesis